MAQQHTTILILICFAAAALLFLYSSFVQEGFDPSERARSIMKGNGLVIVMKAEGCHACDKMRRQALELVKQSPRVVVLNKMSNEKLVQDLGVTQYPSIFIFKGGVATLYTDTDRSYAKLKSLVPE